jgi:pimeloyl-ACP methyl ester carboxylesterase
MGSNLISDVQRLRAAAAATTPSCEPLPRPPWLSEAVWPFSTVSLRVDDENVAVTSAGSGPVLLFVHTGLCSIIWRDVMSMLAADFRCVCLDAPGTGLSERLPPGRIDLNHSAQAVTAVVTELELEELVLIVHDLGGLTGLAGVAEVPERVRGIVAVNTFAWRPAEFRFRAMLALMASPLVRNVDVATGLLPRITATSFGAGRNLDPAGRRALRCAIDWDGLRAFHELMADALRSQAIYAPCPARTHRPVSRFATADYFWRALRPLRVPEAVEVALLKGAPGGGAGRTSLSHV